MTANTEWSGSRARTSSGVKIAAVGAALALAAALASVNLNDRPQVWPMSTQAKANRAYLYEFAMKCKGDFRKLSPEDQAAVQEKCGVDFSPDAMRIIYLDPTGEKGLR